MFADLSELSRNRPAGEETQGRHPGAQPARVLPHVPAEPRRRPGRAAGDLPQPAGPGARPLRRRTTSTARRRWRTRSSGSSWPSSGPRPTSRSSSTFLQQWLTEPLPGDGLRELVGQALEHLDLRHPAAVPGRSATWPAASCSAGPRQPMLRRKRAEVYAGVRGHLRYLDQNPDAPDRAERIATMVASPEPLVRLLGQRIGRPGRRPRPDARGAQPPLLRQPRAAATRDLVEVDGQSLLHRGVRPRRRALPPGRGGHATSTTCRRALDEVGRGSPPPTEHSSPTSTSPGPTSPTRRDGGDPAGDPRPAGAARRCCSGSPCRWPGRPAPRCTTTSRSGPATCGEDRVIRGLHPLIAQRLQLSRLRNFDADPAAVGGRGGLPLPLRRPGQPGRRAAGRDGPGPRPDAAARRRRPHPRAARRRGRAGRLPRRIRRSGAAAARKRFDTNRITIYVWPPIDLTIAELNSVAQRLAADHRRRGPGGGAVPRPAARRRHGPS